jgi:sec-independent protein translocase protein TatB
MFDLGWTELLVIGVVALIVIGPKDLPVMFQTIGRFVGKAKGMAREFSRAMEDAAKDSGVNEVAQGLRAATNPVKTATDSVRNVAKDMTNFDPESETGKLAKERAEAAAKIKEATAKKAEERIAKEKAAKEAAEAAASSDTAAKEPEVKDPE